MKKVLLVATVLMFCAGEANAQLLGGLFGCRQRQHPPIIMQGGHGGGMSGMIDLTFKIKMLEEMNEVANNTGRIADELSTMNQTQQAGMSAIAEAVAAHAQIGSLRDMIEQPATATIMPAPMPAPASFNSASNRAIVHTVNTARKAQAVRYYPRPTYGQSYQWVIRR